MLVCCWPLARTIAGARETQHLIRLASVAWTFNCLGDILRTQKLQESRKEDEAEGRVSSLSLKHCKWWIFLAFKLIHLFDLFVLPNSTRGFSWIFIWKSLVYREMRRKTNGFVPFGLVGCSAHREYISHVCWWRRKASINVCFTVFNKNC